MLDNNECVDPFTRSDLLKWAPGTTRQRDAWDRLRCLCLDYRLRLPTLADIRDSESRLGNGYRAWREGYGEWLSIPDEEFSSVVVVKNEQEGVGLLHFDAGYLFEPLRKMPDPSGVAE